MKLQKSLSALSEFLGNKQYFFGDRPSTLDATAFGTLAQFVEAPLTNSDIKQFIEQNTPNLLEFVRRIQREYWPDWDVLTQHLVMNAEDVNNKQVDSKHPHTTTHTVVHHTSHQPEHVQSHQGHNVHNVPIKVAH